MYDSFMAENYTKNCCLPAPWKLILKETVYFALWIIFSIRNTSEKHSCMCNRRCCIYCWVVPRFHRIYQASSLERYDHSSHHPTTTSIHQKRHYTSKHFSDHRHYSCEQNQISPVKFATFQIQLYSITSKRAIFQIVVF